MVGLHMLDVVVVVWNANQHLAAWPRYFFACPKLPNILPSDMRKARKVRARDLPDAA